MSALHTKLRDRIAVINDRIERACTRASRTPGQVTLIAITKTAPVELLQALLDIGVTHLGENRVAEIVEKVPHLRGAFTMHLVGALQTNKVARVLPFVNMVQSVDRVRLIEYLERYTPAGTTLPVLIEVNTSKEASKSGCTAEEVRPLLERIAQCSTLHAAGYMTIGPLNGNELAVRESFAQLAAIAAAHGDLVAQPHLSMGMSSDFEWAIEEGATMIRIGTLLTGDR